MADLQSRINELQASAGATALERELLTAPIRMVGPTGTAHPGVNDTLKVVLDTGAVGFFKRFTSQSVPHAGVFGHHAFDVPTHEVAAWRLAHALGPPWDELVPTAVLRAIQGEPGALIAEVPGTVDMNAFVDVETQCWAAGFWDALVGQQDRHLGQFRYSPTERRLGLVDHGYCFARTGDLLNDSQFLAFTRSSRGPVVTRPEVMALDGLLSSGDLHGLRRYLPEDRADALHARAEKMATRRMLPLPLSSDF